MKKIIAIALAVLMLAALAVPTFAASSVETAAPVVKGEGETHSGTAVVSYGVSQTYTVVLPSEIDFGTGTSQTPASSATVNVDITELIISGNNKLVVTMDSASNENSSETIWKMSATNGSAPVEYTVTGAQVGEAKAYVTPKTGTIDNVYGEITEQNPATTILTVDSNVGGQGGSVALTFATNGTKQADTYEDTITFGVAIVSVTP